MEVGPTSNAPTAAAHMHCAFWSENHIVHSINVQLHRRTKDELHVELEKAQHRPPLNVYCGLFFN